MIIYEIRDHNVPYMLLCIREISESAYTAFKFGVHEYSLSSIIHCNIYTDLDNRPKVANKIFDFNWTLINSTESQKFHKQFGPKLAKKTIIAYATFRANILHTISVSVAYLCRLILV